MMNGRGKSDSLIEPAKLPNNAEGLAAEAMEGRKLAKGNSPERNALRTQGWESAPSALERVRQAARKDRKQRFTALLHHIYCVERLRTAYLAIKKDGRKSCMFPSLEAAPEGGPPRAAVNLGLVSR